MEHVKFIHLFGSHLLNVFFFPQISYSSLVLLSQIKKDKKQKATK